MVYILYLYTMCGIYGITRYGIYDIFPWLSMEYFNIYG